MPLGGARPVARSGFGGGVLFGRKCTFKHGVLGEGGHFSLLFFLNSGLFCVFFWEKIDIFVSLFAFAPLAPLATGLKANVQWYYYGIVTLFHASVSRLSSIQVCVNSVCGFERLRFPKFDIDNASLWYYCGIPTYYYASVGMFYIKSRMGVIL